MEFQSLVDELLTEYFRRSPVYATQVGIHEHDGRWPDMSEAGRRNDLRFLRGALERLEAVEPGALTPDEHLDRRTLAYYLAADVSAFDDVRDAAWNPMTYVYLTGDGLFLLLAREFAPLEQRLANAVARMTALPALLAQARENLMAPRHGQEGSGSARRVSQFHTEKAITLMAGVADLAREAAEAAEGLEDTELAGRVRTASAIAIEAIEGFATWLREDLLPRADGDFRLGADLYDRKFRHSLKTELTPDQLEARAAADFGEIRGEMVSLARRLWPDWVGTDPMPDEDGAMVRRVLDTIAAEHPAADDLLEYCRLENERIEAFIRERDLVGLAEEPLRIIWTPPFLRAFGGAMLIPPGPLDRGLASFFAITPINEAWSAERRESYLREDNVRMLRLLTIHEAVPGHYLQLAWSNRCPSLVRAIFGSGVFAEGWAVYVTQVMMEVGYGSEDPALMLTHWKFYLRSITNALMDIRIHTGTMDEDEAMRLMVDGGFQEYGEAANKWDRARLSSTQLCEYFLGAVQLTDMEHEARRRADANDGELSWRPFLESLISHGSPPPPILREILAG